MFLSNPWSKAKKLESQLSVERSMLSIERENYRSHIKSVESDLQAANDAIQQKQKDAEVLSQRCQQLENRNKLIETELIANRDLVVKQMEQKDAIRVKVRSMVEGIPLTPKTLQNNKQLKADLSVAQKALSDILTLVNER
jgi:chromosome segregation ATPase